MSDTKVAEPVPAGAPVETAPAVTTEAPPAATEPVVASETVAPAAAAPASEPAKTEDKSKTPTKKEKGALGLGFFKKLFGKKDKKTEAPTTSS